MPLKSSSPCINSAHKPSGARCTKNLLAARCTPRGHTDSLPSLQQAGPVQTPPLHTSTHLCHDHLHNTPAQDTNNTTLSVTSACRLCATCLVQPASTHAHLSCHTEALPRP